jgi:hypothetical protein
VPELRARLAPKWLAFLDELITLPSFASILRGAKVDELHKFPARDEPKIRAHLLMRLLEQLILAEAVGYMHFDPIGPQLEVNEIFEMLERFDKRGGFEDVHEVMRSPVRGGASPTTQSVRRCTWADVRIERHSGQQAVFGSLDRTRTVRGRQVRHCPCPFRRSYRSSLSLRHRWQMERK